MPGIPSVNLLWNKLVFMRPDSGWCNEEWRIFPRGFQQKSTTASFDSHCLTRSAKKKDNFHLFVNSLCNGERSVRHMIQKWYPRSVNQANSNLANDSNEQEITCGHRRRSLVFDAHHIFSFLLHFVMKFSWAVIFVADEISSPGENINISIYFYLKKKKASTISCSCVRACVSVCVWCTLVSWIISKRKNELFFFIPENSFRGKVATQRERGESGIRALSTFFYSKFYTEFYVKRKER